ncbi:MAG: hypothetical protein GX944_02200 [Alphaproteobacteria bacterium]|nr:hypothetical protein [Alphaproteobacteria bacterium]
MAKYTKEEITAMADRCYQRCWRCHRYEPAGNAGVGRGGYLFSFAGNACYEAYDLPWKSGNWCKYYGNKNHPDSEILKYLTWYDVENIKPATKLSEPYALREKILFANPEIATLVEYCNNSNESRDQYFNQAENHAIIEFDKFNVYCETLRRYRFSLVDNRLLYPGANEWIRPMMVCYDKETYKSIESCVDGSHGFQISFACSPKENYQLNKDIFSFNSETKEVLAEFKQGTDLIQKYCLSLGRVL